MRSLDSLQGVRVETAGVHAVGLCVVGSDEQQEPATGKKLRPAVVLIASALIECRHRTRRAARRGRPVESGASTDRKENRSVVIYAAHTSFADNPDYLVASDSRWREGHEHRTPCHRPMARSLPGGVTASGCWEAAESGGKWPRDGANDQAGAPRSQFTGSRLRQAVLPLHLPESEQHPATGVLFVVSGFSRTRPRHVAELAGFSRPSVGRRGRFITSARLRAIEARADRGSRFVARGSESTLIDVVALRS
jgi:hypothetical protein